MATRAWLVDLDGTLYRAMPVKLAMAAELAIVAPHHVRLVSRFRAMHEIVRDEQGRHEAGRDVAGYELQLLKASQESGVEVERLRGVIHEWMIERPCKWLARFPREPLVTELRAFRRAGGRAAVVSDYPARLKLRALGIDDLFDCVVANGEPGGPPRMKPDPAGYLEAARQLGIPPDECLVVGDRDDADGEAARRAGMPFRRV